VVGVIEPGARAAAERSRSGRIGVIGTNATIGSNAYARLIRILDSRIKVFSLACPLFVPLAEEGYVDKEATRLIARDYLASMQEVGVDTLVLGCTHYPLLERVIREVMGEGVTLIDSGEETARVVAASLAREGLLRAPAHDASVIHRYFVSDVPDKFSAIASRFLGKQIENTTRVDISTY
jgi:glutamate racemase